MNDDGAAHTPAADSNWADDTRADEDWAAEDPEWTQKADRLESRLRRGEVSMTEAEAELRRLLDDQSLPPEAPAPGAERGRTR